MTSVSLPSRIIANEEAADRPFLRVVNARERGELTLRLTCDEAHTLASELWALAGIARAWHEERTEAVKHGGGR